MSSLIRIIPPWGRRLLAIIGVLLVLGMFFMVFQFEPEHAQRSEKVGLVLPYAKNDPGWAGSHYQGMKSASEEYGTELLIRENVSTEGCAQAVRELIADGAGMIFLCGNTYPAAARQVIADNPKIAFATMAIGADAPNVTVYFARMHQGRYLAGALAATQTKSGVLGYVAAAPRAPVIREINAFTLGARRTNPNIRVVVAWTDAWADPEKETEAVRRLVQEKGADVVTYHQDDQAVPDACEALGVDYIGFNVRLKDRSEHHLGSVVCRWDIYYRNVLQKFLKRELNALKNRWIGVNAGAVWLADVPERVSLDAGYGIANLRRDIESRRSIFRGPIRDTAGVLRVGDREVLQDDALIYRMDWFVEGVEFLGK